MERKRWRHVGKEESFTRWRERDEGMLVKKSHSLDGEKEMKACW